MRTIYESAGEGLVDVEDWEGRGYSRPSSADIFVFLGFSTFVRDPTKARTIDRSELASRFSVFGDRFFGAHKVTADLRSRTRLEIALDEGGR